MIKDYCISSAILGINPNASVKVKRNDFDLIEWGTTTPITESDLDTEGLNVRRGVLKVATKSECERRILLSYPYFKQQNIVRSSVLSGDNTGTTSLDTFVNDLITECDSIESEIDTLNLTSLSTYDVKDDAKWV